MGSVHAWQGAAGKDLAAGIGGVCIQSYPEPILCTMLYRIYGIEHTHTRFQQGQDASLHLQRPASEQRHTIIYRDIVLRCASAVHQVSGGTIYRTLANGDQLELHAPG